MRVRLILIVFVGLLVLTGYLLLKLSNPKLQITDGVLAAKFEELSSGGNSSCSQDFKDSIANMLDTSRLQGSCCSPMNFHRYKEQVEGLKKYKEISEIPSDPYDIEASIAKKLLPYYDLELSSEEQKKYDYAMANSDEKGPCCCKCWRWYVYEGLGKYLIREKGFTGEQVTEVWNLSDGCGGEGDHVNHTT
ncbi:hypothetical protein A2865_00300 [Candidatus Woesebacteria bacterium RIFCSPHIGHO2_01_FULL_39_17]|uniref:Uncharacterized protein n=3 Tax=Candidatus Woeseibacteriota TaxID=1752722 RepID=A0A0G0NAS0_9BACT|nr:MAG: hypothetical protein US72_C0008G0021 [Microgenomates group bacterium GW2011_GWC1_38_12]KKQ93820.1 MAG: hypothetical protein UT19_C0007G0064 [Candidatus Woesebacteria bacterium GW2011_GWB1_39_10b]KKR13239.1 MAG: hypothetical protein UT40_C0021G0021 [Candidatus Woesebacteria bacterium GW2011_GWA1_39_21b]OGM24154.1 MAG: hypothetical protein A2865_00300 [Candidatus Woesebacteria bacterium RIFCSPHIGHO2_01_FULL_39_17]OGM63373.1 MAG: hypothetical protein A3A52_04430 [Candidatus Woesebacteria b